jgi:alpha-tubulin suppressor-like RCC1 family protein
MSSNAPTGVSAVGGGGSLSSVIAVSAGNAHTCAVTSSNEVVCWGFNGTGELGDGSQMDRHAPVFVTDSSSMHLSGITAVSAGGHHTCALSTSGAVSCWGANNSGQLGNGSVVFQSDVALPVNGLPEPAIAISAGDAHTCAVTSSGGAWCWGSSSFGQLGNPQAVPVGVSSVTPVQVLGVNMKPLTGFSSVSAGTTSTCGLISGLVACWGDVNPDPKGSALDFLGNGPPTNSSPAATVLVGPQSEASVSVNGGTTCLVSKGSVQCWGFNSAGELGNGMMGDSPTPGTPVSGLSTATSVSVGTVDFACALTGGDAVWCWGLDSVGQLGNSGFTGPFSGVPVEVTGF